MKNQNIVIIAMVSALAFTLAPFTGAQPSPQGGPTKEAANAPAAAATQLSSAVSPEGENRPIITIHSAGNILRGKTGSFVLKMSPPVMFGGTYVNFKVSGTAGAGVDYRPLLSPARIGKSGYGVISVATLLDPRGSFNNQAYSVVVTLERGLGYFVGEPSSATIWISSSCALEACW
jgi:hypothetical protein